MKPNFAFLQFLKRKFLNDSSFNSDSGYNEIKPNFEFLQLLKKCFK